MRTMSGGGGGNSSWLNSGRGQGPRSRGSVGNDVGAVGVGFSVGRGVGLDVGRVGLGAGNADIGVGVSCADLGVGAVTMVQGVATGEPPSTVTGVAVSSRLAVAVVTAVGSNAGAELSSIGASPSEQATVSAKTPTARNRMTRENLMATNTVYSRGP